VRPVLELAGCQPNNILEPPEIDIADSISKKKKKYCR
jgi:hypothetical protein